MSAVVADAVEHLVRGIVANPDDVHVELITSRRGRTVEVHVHPDDLGKVIGRGGRGPAARLGRLLLGGVGLHHRAVDRHDRRNAAGAGDGTGRAEILRGGAASGLARRPKNFFGRPLETGFRFSKSFFAARAVCRMP